MNKKQKAAAIALSAVMACGIFAGCDLVTTNTSKDLEQVVATVNIAKSKSFKGEFGDIANTVEQAQVSKLEMIMSYISNGGDNLVNSYGSAKAAFDAIANSLVQRQIYLQYAKAFFLKNGWEDEDDKENGVPKKYTYTQAGYEAAVADKTGIERELAGLGYFLTDKNKAVAEYNLRVSFNNSLDSLEKEIIDEENDIEYESTVRTTPTGVNTANSDYVAEGYKIYTGTGKQATVEGGYETVDGSTPAYRKRAYYQFISQLHANNLVEKGEDTSDVETLSYYKMQKRNNYASLLIQKLGDAFTKEAAATINEQYCLDSFNTTKANQLKDYTADISKLESEMDSMSDTSFVLTAPESVYEFGFVVNILLPFSTAQSDALSAADKDFGDAKGNKFSTRASLLQKVTATDQRGSWFTGETDYSYKPESTAAKYTGGNDKREWLFFEDNFAKDTKYDVLKNYYGQYTYNGTYDEENRTYKPTPIGIDGFLGEMKGYLNYALGADSVTVVSNSTDDYYKQNNWYKADGTVDYEKFVYESGRVEFPGGFNANNLFVAGSRENKAYSVIRELSFAYNTDTAGLNTYLGYAVTANKTDFVSEFEYAAQQAVLLGAGNYVVVPSDYGWHVIYCTFSFSQGLTAENHARIDSPFTFDYGDIEKEGSFSNLFYESIKANTASTASSNRQTKLLADYDDSYEIFEARYKNLTSN